MKHTKGPWHINSHPYENQPEYVLAKPTNTGDDCRDVVSVATITRSQNTLAGWRSKEEAIANARLIAAAPEMLDSLKIAVVRLKEIQYQKASPKQIEFLESVIAKAEGRAK